MQNPSFGFIGGGRIVRIMLAAFQRKNVLPSAIVICDPDSNAVSAIKVRFRDPGIVFASDNAEAAKQDYVFLAVHPPLMKEVLSQVAPHISKESFVISLAPKFRISNISELLGGHPKVVRMIPNAATWMNRGFNPITFEPRISFLQKEQLTDLLHVFGAFPEVEEDKLEAYAILTAMGPTYFWFQFNELQQLSSSFGLTEDEFKTGLKETVSGAVDTLFDSGLTYEEVVDLIPVKPISEHEAQFRDAYKTKLNNLYQKLTE
jgi:pyrroline-5-carboxylate reductase